MHYNYFSEIIADDGHYFVTYGIRLESSEETKICISDITFSETQIQRLCNMLNEHMVDLSQVYDVVEDFISELNTVTVKRSLIFH